MVNPNEMEHKSNEKNSAQQKKHDVDKQLHNNSLRRMNSLQNKMSRGAQHIWRIIKSRINFGQKGSGNTHNKKKHPSLKRPK